MGQLANGINGQIKGKVGALIGSSWKGIPYVKGPYKKRTKKISKKEAGNRSKFSQAQFWLKPVLDLVREGFRGYSARSEGFVAAKSYLLLNAFEGVSPDNIINPALVKVSFGTLPLPDDIAVERIAPNRLKFTWQPRGVDDAHPQDQVMLLAYDIEQAAAFFTTTGQFRKAGEDILEIDPGKGHTYHLYVAFTAADRTRQSHSVYLGTIKS